MHGQGDRLYTPVLWILHRRKKKLLDGKGIAYRENDATFSADLRKEMVQRAHGRSTFPQIFIGETHVGGCDELYALEGGGKLDQLLQSVA